MKSFILCALVLSSSALSLAHAASGTALFEDVRGTSRATIQIAGDSARLMFESLSNSRISSSMDASESPDGRHQVWKDGVNYNCRMRMGLPGQNSQFTCYIPLVSKSGGVVGAAGVAYPRTNSGVTNTPGTSSVNPRTYQTRRGQVLTLRFFGPAAERAYNLLDVRVNRYNSELNGDLDTYVKEEARNISCKKVVKRDRPVSFSCEMLIESKAAGRITHPGVG